MSLPGSARMHVWVGLIVALVGVLVGGYAYTGWRIYHLHYLPVALVGLVLVLGGSALAGYGQANRPRLGGRDASEKPSLVDRLRRRLEALKGSQDTGSQAEESQEDTEAASSETARDEDA